jgi:hypothetical protein
MPAFCKILHWLITNAWCTTWPDTVAWWVTQVVFGWLVGRQLELVRVSRPRWTLQLRFAMSLIIEKNDVKRPIKESSLGLWLFGRFMLSSDREWTRCEHISPVVKRAIVPLWSQLWLRMARLQTSHRSNCMIQYRMFKSHWPYHAHPRIFTVLSYWGYIERYSTE